MDEYDAEDNCAGDDQRMVDENGTGASRVHSHTSGVSFDEQRSMPFHRQYEQALGAPIPSPPCSTQGISPWRRPSGLYNRVQHVVVPASVKHVSEVIGEGREARREAAVWATARSSQDHLRGQHGNAGGARISVASRRA